MKLGRLGYSIKQGCKNIRRNMMFSLASIGTIVACLFLFGTFYAIVVNFQTAVSDVQSQVTISVFFDEDITSDQMTAIGEEIRLRKEINTMDYISAQMAWEKFLDQTYPDSKQQVMDTFGDDNPLAHSASYEITLKDVSKQDEFVKYLQGLEGVRQVNSSEVAASSLATINVLVSYASMAIIVILLLVSIFLISNTVTIGITVRKEEIAIMKLIGATNSFVRSPFLVEGFIIGLVGSVIPIGLLYFMYDALTGYVTERFPIVNTLITFVPEQEIFKILAPVMIGVGVFIGLFGSAITTRRHLKV